MAVVSRLIFVMIAVAGCFVCGQTGTAGVPITNLPPARTLYCLTTINEISSIDAVLQNFYGDIGLICYYQEPLLNLTPAEYNYVPLSASWLTTLGQQQVLFNYDFSNKLNIAVDPATTVTFYGVGPSTPPIVSTFSQATTILPGAHWIAYYARYSGTFKAQLQLADFPFDTQTLFVNITCWIVYPYRASFFANWKAGYQMLPESTRRNIVGWEVVGTSEVNGTLYGAMFDVYFPTMSYAIKLKRDPQYYVNKLIVGVVLLTVISNTMFFMDFDVPDRPAGNLACFLGIVTYLFIISGDVPKLPYSTRMDNFVYVSFYIVFSGFVINIFLHQIVSKPMKFYEMYSADELEEAAEANVVPLGAPPTAVSSNPFEDTPPVAVPSPSRYRREGRGSIDAPMPLSVQAMFNQRSSVFRQESNVFGLDRQRSSTFMMDPSSKNMVAAAKVEVARPEFLRRVAEFLAKWQGTVDWALFIVSNLVYLIGACIALLA